MNKAFMPLILESGQSFLRLFTLGKSMCSTKLFPNG